MKLGRSQQAVLDLLKCDGPSYTQFFGDQLYETHSSAYLEHHAYWNTGRRGPIQVRRHWASGILRDLMVKGLVDFKKEGRERIWFLTEAGKNA